MSSAPVLSTRWIDKVHEDVTPGEIADDCRAAALAFVDGTSREWGKRELASWLVGPYARAVRFAGGASHQICAEAHPHLDDDSVRATLRDARWVVMSELESAALPRGGTAFAERLFEHGLVLPARTHHGLAWVPVDAPHERLRTRVLALFAADALARPLDYERTLLVCHRCERVEFDPVARQRGYCARHPH